MSHAEVLAHIQRILGDLATAKGVPIGPIGESTALLGGDLPIDSLDLAALVVELEEITGCDPFQAGFTDFRTAGDLSRLYAR
jgi:acyl carrier protein